LQFEGTPLWRIVESAVSALKENGDITITTEEQYVFGFLVKSLASALPGSVLTEVEAVGVHNAINEVCNGVHIEDPEFQARLGISRAELSNVLRKL
jgi:hypothetical protein